MKPEDIYIEWRGEILAKIGYGIQARRILDLIYRAGIKVKLLPAENYLPPNMKIDDPLWINRIEESKSLPAAPIRINYCIPTVAEFSPTAFNILYTMWETNKYPIEWTSIINKSHLFIAGCPSLVESAKKSGVTTPIEWLMPPINTKKWCKKGEKIEIDGINDDTVVFIFIGNWIPRKNYDDLLLAYSTAFSGYKDTMLIIKTWGGDNSANFRKQLYSNVANQVGRYTHIEHPKRSIITDVLSEEQIIKLMRNADYYFSMSHGEGLDLPMVQAMAMGIIPITTRFLAHGDYLDNSNSLGIDYSLMPITNPGAPFYGTDQMWARPNMEDAINKLRRAYEIKKGTTKIKDLSNENAIKSAEKNFSEQTVINRTFKILAGAAKAVENAKNNSNISAV